MLKESILLVASTGLVIYFITPSEESRKAQPAPAEVQEMIQPVAQITEDSWEDDESEEDDNENFVFGEPMTLAGSESEEEIGEEENSASLRYQADARKSKGGSFSGGRGPTSPASPRPGDPGSIQNPIELSGNNGSAMTGANDR